MLKCEEVWDADSRPMVPENLAGLFHCGLFVGLLLTFGASGNFAFLPPDLTSVYFPLLMFGWITQLIIDVAYGCFRCFLARSRMVVRPSPGPLISFLTLD
jgi:hypothetical protein